MSDFTPADLPRVAERIPYLYLEQCVLTLPWLKPRDSCELGLLALGR